MPLFRSNAVMVISDGIAARIGSLTSEAERFMPWRTIDGTTIAITPPLVRGDPVNVKADVSVELVARKSTEQHVALVLTPTIME